MTRAFDPFALPVRDHPLVLEASAGTGKTFAIVQLALRMLLDDTTVASRGPRHLLLVTFTRAATAELQERLRGAIRAAEAIAHGRRPARPQEAWLQTLIDRLGPAARARTTALLGQLDELAVTTIHGFCVGVLREFAADCGVHDELVFLEDDSALVSELLDDAIRAATWQDPWTAAVIAAAPWTSASLRAAVATRRSARPPAPPLDPDVLLQQAQRCREALDTLRTSWDRARLTARLDAVQWLADETFALAALRHEHLEAIDRLMTGDASGLLGVLPFAEKTLRDQARKRSAPEKAALSALKEDPAFTRLDAASAALRAWQDAMHETLIAAVVERLPSRKMADGVMTYDDQIRLVGEALLDPVTGPRLQEALHRRFDAVLVDEAQDTDPEQWRVIAAAFARRPRILVGDPKQAIYGWRGADLQTYLTAREEAGPAHTFQLDRNWRSIPALLDALERLMTRAPDPFGVPATQMDFVPVTAATTGRPLDDPASTAALRWLVAETDGGIDVVRQQIRRTIVTEIHRLLTTVTRDGQPLRPGDLAILVRTNAEGARYQDALREVGIHAVVSGGGDIVGTTAWHEVALLVRALAAPAHEPRRRAAAATALMGFSAAELVAWHIDPDTAPAIAWQHRLTELAEHARQTGTVAALSHLFAARDTVSRLAALPRGERRLTDLRHVLELMQEQEATVGGAPRQIADWMAHTAADSTSEATTGERRQLRLESDADAVQIRTIHVAKGLQYPVVFVPGGWSAPREGTAAALAEELRLFYVAVTRAEARCYLTLATTPRSKDWGPLGHLLRPLDGVDDGWSSRREAVAALLAACPGVMDTVAPTSTPPAPLPAAPPQSLAPRHDAPRPLTSWGITSYSRLVASDHATEATPRDIFDAAPESAPPPASDPPSALDLLPAGPRTGSAIHALFEHLPFDADDATITARVQQVLRTAGIGREFSASRRAALHDAVTTMAAETLRTPIPTLGLTLATVPATATLREWTFHLRLTRQDLPRLVEQFRAVGGEFARYADHLAPLCSQGIDGYLTGTIDLACQHEGRWYLIDWKSNRLGAGPSAYTPEALEHAMTTHHYYLQQALYQMALARYLERRVPAWDPATMFGGVGYAFVRGNAWWVAGGGEGSLARCATFRRV